jgi:hypothetical protein
VLLARIACLADWRRSRQTTPNLPAQGLSDLEAGIAATLAEVATVSVPTNTSWTMPCRSCHCRAPQTVSTFALASGDAQCSTVAAI